MERRGRWLPFAILGVGLLLLIGAAFALSKRGVIWSRVSVNEWDGYRGTYRRSAFGWFDSYSRESDPGIVVTPQWLEKVKASGITFMKGTEPSSRNSRCLHIYDDTGAHYYRLAAFSVTPSASSVIAHYQRQLTTSTLRTFSGAGPATKHWSLTGICLDGKTRLTISISEMASRPTVRSLWMTWNDAKVPPIP